MERLSSCYFCGTAMDAPLSEYPVIPSDLDPDPDAQAAVTLCPTCRRKLAVVVERVVDAAEAVGVDPSGPAPDGPVGDAGKAGGPVGADGVDRTGDADRTDGETTGGADGMDDPGEEAAATAGDGRADDAGGGRTGSGGDEGERGGEDGRRDASDGGDDHGDGEDADGDLTDAGGEDGAEGGDGASDGDGDGGPTITALEYNRVMRLLENRELPVDRAEFEALATNAYEVSPSTVETVVEAAIERGHLAERGGRLIRPDGS